jgi:hypothetical protein
VGTSLLRRWLIRPLLSIPDIEARHQAVAVLIRPDNQASVSEVMLAMKKVKNVYRLLNQLRGGTMYWGVWKGVMDVSAMHCLPVGPYQHIVDLDLPVPCCDQSTTTAHRRSERSGHNRDLPQSEYDTIPAFCVGG